MGNIYNNIIVKVYIGNNIYDCVERREKDSV